MSSLNPASGDKSEIPICLQKDGEMSMIHDSVGENLVQNDITSKNTTELNGKDDKEDQVNSEQEKNLKERIEQCRIIIESLKTELNHEKTRLEKESKTPPLTLEEAKVTTDSVSKSLNASCPPDFYTSCVENKLNCDENLIQYERQLQRYQNTLNMAQNEKKNAIRKQMIAKAYKLKLLEVENQCNIELLRIKQSLQCLEPLQMIVNKWKTSTDDNSYDLNSFELMPRFPELNGVSGSDICSTTGDSENKTAITLD